MTYDGVDAINLANSILALKKENGLLKKALYKQATENRRLKRAVSRLERENDSLLWEINNSLEDRG